MVIFHSYVSLPEGTRFLLFAMGFALNEGLSVLLPGCPRCLATSPWVSLSACVFGQPRCRHILQTFGNLKSNSERRLSVTLLLGFLTSILAITSL